MVDPVDPIQMVRDGAILRRAYAITDEGWDEEQGEYYIGEVFYLVGERIFQEGDPEYEILNKMFWNDEFTEEEDSEFEFGGDVHDPVSGVWRYTLFPADIDRLTLKSSENG